MKMVQKIIPLEEFEEVSTCKCDQKMCNVIFSYKNSQGSLQATINRMWSQINWLHFWRFPTSEIASFIVIENAFHIQNSKTFKWMF
jgi:hypothetical protein